MPQRIPGIHHVTAIAGDPQQNLDFYASFLGLPLSELGQHLKLAPWLGPQRTRIEGLLTRLKLPKSGAR